MKRTRLQILLAAILMAAGWGIWKYTPAAQADAPASPQSSRVVKTEAAPPSVEYRLLATSKTSTMQKEMSEAADAGFRFAGVMGGETAFGGKEVTAIMCRDGDVPPKSRYEYKLLAATRTSTMQKEMQEVGDAGFEYCGQTVFESLFGGKEVLVIVERDRDKTPVHYEYRLLATSKTSTMQKELQEAGDAGFAFVGVTVAQTALGGKELVTILRRLPVQ